MGLIQHDLAQKYPDLAEYLEMSEYDRDENSPMPRLNALNEAITSNNAEGVLEVPVRSADEGDYEEHLDALEGTHIMPALWDFEIERAVTGLVSRAVKAVENGEKTITVEKPLLESAPAVKDLARAVSIEVGRKIRFIRRSSAENGILHFARGERTKSKFEMALGDTISETIAVVVEKLTGIDTIDPRDRGREGIWEGPDSFFEDYMNEWIRFGMLMDGEDQPENVKKRVSEMAQAQVREHGVVIRTIEQYFPKRLHKRVITKSTEHKVSELNDLANRVNKLYFEGRLSGSEFKRTIQEAHAILIRKSQQDTITIQ